MVEGGCRLAVDGAEPVSLAAGDFVLLPATPGFVLSGFEPAVPVFIDPEAMPAPTGELRHGRPDGPPDVRLLGGYFVFASPDAGLLVSLLPRLLHVRGVARLATLVRLVGEEAAAPRAGSALVLTRLVEVLLIEALARPGDDPDADHASLMLPYYPRACLAPNGELFDAGEQRMSRYLDVAGRAGGPMSATAGSARATTAGRRCTRRARSSTPAAVAPPAPPSHRPHQPRRPGRSPGRWPSRGGSSTSPSSPTAWCSPPSASPAPPSAT